jgi:hypothetical protein
MATDNADPQRILEMMIALTGEMQGSCFPLGDVYGDVIAANNMMLAFYEVPPAMTRDMRQASLVVTILCV